MAAVLPDSVFQLPTMGSAAKTVPDTVSIVVMAVAAAAPASDFNDTMLKRRHCDG